MDREGPYLYTGCKYRGISIENPGRGMQQLPPPSEDVLQKIPQEDEG